MQSKAGLFKFAFVAVAVAAALWFWRHRAPEAAVISGTVEVDEVHLASRYGGRIVKLPFEEGARLEAGDLIAELDAAELVARRDLAAARLKELEAGPRPKEIAAALRDWEALQAQLTFAVADSRRGQELLKQRAIANAEAERSASTENALRSSAEAARARYELLEEGTRPEQIAQARAQLAEIEAQLRETRITAPAASTLEVLSVRQGDVAPPNREIATLLLADRLWIRVYVPATWLPKLALGQKAELRLDGEPETAFPGVVEQISRVAEFTPRNVQTPEDRMRQVYGVKIRLPDSSGRLRAGMTGVVRFPGLAR